MLQMIFLCTHLFFFNNAQKGWAIGSGINGGVLLKTTDGGEQWEQIELAPDWDGFGPIYFIDENNGFITGGTSGSTGIFWQTTDGGNTWEEQIIENLYFRELCFVSAEDAYLLNIDDDRVYYTNDGGESWSNLEMPFGKCRALSFVDHQNGWAVGLWGAVLKYTGNTSVTKDIKLPASIEMTIYPNPANGLVQVIFPNDDADWIQLISLSGQVLRTIPCKGQQAIDLSELLPGVYVIRALGEQGSVAKKIVLTN